MINWLEEELDWWWDFGGGEGSGAGRSEAERNISAQGGLTVGLRFWDLEEVSFLTSMCLTKCLSESLQRSPEEREARGKKKRRGE